MGRPPNEDRGSPSNSVGRTLRRRHAGQPQNPARTPHVYGLDLDHAALRRNATIAGRAVGAGEVLPFADGSFDLVKLAWVLEHLDERSGCRSRAGRDRR